MSGNNHAEPPTQQVRVSLPQFVYLGGFCLPYGSFLIEPSPLQPTLCFVTLIINHSLMPPVVRALLELATKAAPPANGLPPQLSDLRCCAWLPTDRGPQFADLQVRGVKLLSVAPKPDAEKAAGGS